MARALLRTAVLAMLALAASAGGAQAQPRPPQFDGPDFTPEQMQQGIQLSPQQCSAYSQTVWVVAQGVGVCIRYYISTAGGQSDEVVYWLSGDKSGDTLVYSPTQHARTAERMSRQYRRPAVYLARVGIDGSSGSHSWRRTWFEVEATSRAIDAINARHGFRVVHVMGQSGGGHLTGSLVGIRSDVGCAVPGAGRLAFDAHYIAGQARRQPFLRHYDPATRVREVAARSASTRILVVTEPRDQRVQVHFQTGFVERVQRAGGQISQFLVTAFDDLHHNVVFYTREAMAGCLSGAPDAEIDATLQRITAFEQARRAAQQAGQQPPTNFRQAVRPFQVPPPGNPRIAARPMPPHAMPPHAMPPRAVPMPRMAGPAHGAPSMVPAPTPHRPAPVLPRVERPAHGGPSTLPPPPPPGIRVAAPAYGTPSMMPPAIPPRPAPVIPRVGAPAPVPSAMPSSVPPRGGLLAPRVAGPAHGAPPAMPSPPEPVMPRVEAPAPAAPSAAPSTTPPRRGLLAPRVAAPAQGAPSAAPERTAPSAAPSGPEVTEVERRVEEVVAPPQKS